MPICYFLNKKHFISIFLPYQLLLSTGYSDLDLKEEKRKVSVSIVGLIMGGATIVQGGANEFYKEGDQNAF